MTIIERHQLKDIFAALTHPVHPVFPEQQLLRLRFGHHAIPRLRPQRWIDQHTVTHQHGGTPGAMPLRLKIADGRLAHRSPLRRPRLPKHIQATPAIESLPRR
ncbi:hypothetical protein [Delftia tsuruhatensis]|uniref:hypothetical protein n=1 Tax=Delftia tsuruhatensis TaxID=180282 RepID=UPI001F196E4E|nr:hypothetical protein [Delftia tsuruhatensis]